MKTRNWTLALLLILPCLLPAEDAHPVGKAGYVEGEILVEFASEESK